jgi:hypothetical protein
MRMKGEGGMLEFIGAYGKLIVFGMLITIVLIMLVISFVNSHPEIGVDLPTIFGGTSGSSAGG